MRDVKHLATLATYISACGSLRSRCSDLQTHRADRSSGSYANIGRADQVRAAGQVRRLNVDLTVFIEPSAVEADKVAGIDPTPTQKGI